MKVMNKAGAAAISERASSASNTKSAISPIVNGTPRIVRERIVTPSVVTK